MTTLTTAPLAPLLDRLFREAEAASPAASPAVAELSADERERLMQSKTEYLDYYGRLKDMPLAVSRETGRLLYMLARSCGARTIVEFGTSFGISTLHLAAALRDNGGGRLITTEFEPRGPAIIFRPAVSSTWWRYGWATPCKRSALIFPKRSTCFCSTAPRRCIPRS